MADTVSSIVLVNTGTHYSILLLGRSDGTGESNVVKIDKSALTDVRGLEPLAIDITGIQFSVSATHKSVDLSWDHGTDNVAAYLSGTGKLCFDENGPLKDPKINDGTGDLLLTVASGGTSGTYSILIDAKLRLSA